MDIYATDFDGTVTYHGVTPALLCALDRWKAAGNLFGVVTGRPYDSIIRAVREVKLPLDFLIANNGSIIADGNDGILEYTSFTAETVMKLAELFRSENHGYFRLDAIRFYREWSGAPDTFIKDGHIVADGTEYPEYTEITVDYPDYESCLRGRENVRRVTDGMADAFLPGRSSIDCNPAGANKAAAIRRIPCLFGVNPDVIYTTGDSFNDLSMLTAPDFEGYAVANADETVRQLTGRVVDDPLELINKALERQGHK